MLKEKGESSRAMVRQGYKAASLAVIDNSEQNNGDADAAAAPTAAEVVNPQHHGEAPESGEEDLNDSLTDHHHWHRAEEEEEEAGDGLTSRQKTALGFIW